MHLLQDSKGLAEKTLEQTTDTINTIEVPDTRSEWNSSEQLRGKKNVKKFYLQIFTLFVFSGSGSHCLDDNPSDFIHEPSIFHNKLPGQIANSTLQCILQYGSEYFQCPQKKVGQVCFLVQLLAESHLCSLHNRK